MTKNGPSYMYLMYGFPFFVTDSNIEINERKKAGEEPMQLSSLVAIYQFQI